MAKALARLAGVVPIAGIVLVVAGGGAAPPGFYQEKDREKRAQLARRHPTRWLLNNLLGALGVVAEFVL